MNGARERYWRDLESRRQYQKRICQENSEEEKDLKN